MVAVSSTSDLTHDCMVPNCNSLGIILVGNGRPKEMALICTMHYGLLVRLLKEDGKDEDEIDNLSAEDILNIVTGNEFQRVVKRILDEEKFKAAVRKAIRRGEK